MFVQTSSYFTIADTDMKIYVISDRIMTESPMKLGEIIRSSTEFREHDSCANGNNRIITPTDPETAKHITSANAAAVRIRSFVRMVRYLIRRDWSARAGILWIAPARKVSTPLTRRLQKQWRKLIGEHVLRNELFKIHTMYCASIFEYDYIINISLFPMI